MCSPSWTMPYGDGPEMFNNRLPYCRHVIESGWIGEPEGVNTRGDLRRTIELASETLAVDDVNRKRIFHHVAYCVSARDRMNFERAGGRAFVWRRQCIQGSQLQSRALPRRGVERKRSFLSQRCQPHADRAPAEIFRAVRHQL